MVSFLNGPLALGLTALMLGACASGGQSMDAGQRMSARGDSIAGRGAEWSDGQRDVRKGEQMLAKSADKAADGQKDLRKAQERARDAENQIRTAQADRQTAERLVADGMAQMRRAEADYATIRGQSSVVLP